MLAIESPTQMTSPAPSIRRVRVLEIDPDLGVHLSVEERRRADAACWAAVVRVPTGVWALPDRFRHPASVYALVVVDGVLCQETSLGSGAVTELMIAGDVFSPEPSADGGADELISTTVTLSALNPVQVMVLSESFVRAGGIWPGLMLALRDRLTAQRSHLASQGLALQLARVADRVLLTLWLLADRCGTVTPQGTVQAFRIPHEALGRLTGARRPTVSLALSGLRQEGLIETSLDGRIILTPRPSGRWRRCSLSSWRDLARRWQVTFDYSLRNSLEGNGERLVASARQTPRALGRSARATLGGLFPVMDRSRFQTQRVSLAPSWWRMRTSRDVMRQIVGSDESGTLGRSMEMAR